MADDNTDDDDLESRLDRLETTLEALRDEIEDDRRDDAAPGIPNRTAERALRLTERVAVPAAVAALEANVRVLTFVQERLRELEERDSGGRGDARIGGPRVSERMLDRLDDALVRLEDGIADADLPQNADARRLLERARDLNEEVRGRVVERERFEDRPTVIEIDVEEELDQIRDDVADDGPDGADEGAEPGDEEEGTGADDDEGAGADDDEADDADEA